METVQILDKTFESFITSEEIERIIKKMSTEMESLVDANPLFIIVLNGSFIFASDLLKNLSFDAEIDFIKLSSYQGTQSTGVIKEHLSLQRDVTDRTIVIIEDIIDTGTTLKYLVNQFEIEKPKKILVASLLFKPSAYQHNIGIDYVGKEIANEFVVGYGLDYEELGRTLPHIYKLKN
jgi:hypoxanthine phosphoribosyltransferase